MTEKRRIPWVAGLLSLLAVGLGHVYCGKWKKGFTFLLLFFLLAVPVFYAITLGLPFSPWNVLLPVIFILSIYVYIIRDAIKSAEDLKEGYQLKFCNKWYAYLVFLFIAQLTLEAYSEYVTKAYKIPSGAMIPTLLIGDHILTDKVTYLLHEPNRGDIITFPYPEDETKMFIKRIVGLPGDTIQLRNKTVYINGEPLKDEAWTQRVDPEVIDARINPRDNFGPKTIPTKSYFVMGDNRDQSLDSRFWGYVQREKIEGRVQIIYWSYGRLGLIIGEGVRWGRIGQRLG